MKRILMLVLFFVLLMSLKSMSNTHAAPPPPTFTATHSIIYPTLDGHLGGAEWNDTTKSVVTFASSNITISAWLYLKHNGTHIHIGYLLWAIYTHQVDRFAIIFDEGDDGSYGSGTRDYTRLHVKNESRRH